MKRSIKLNIEIPDDYLKEWNERFYNFHLQLYNNDAEKARQTLKDNPFETTLGEDIVEHILNYYGSDFKCDFEIIK